MLTKDTLIPFGVGLAVGAIVLPRVLAKFGKKA